MNNILKKALLAPFMLMCPALCAVGTDTDGMPDVPDEGYDAVQEIDLEALGRIVDSRIARAEKGVLRDYFARNGLEGDDAARAEERYRRYRSEARPDKSAYKELERKCSQAEQRARALTLDSAARVQMARMGVADDCAEDVLVLARRQLERDGTELPADTAEASALVSRAVEKVLSRLPQLAAENSGTGGALGSGSTGNFPRNGGQNVLQQQLESLRAAGDTVSAVALINSAAEKGISLR